ncbi:MAG: glutamine--fructose-6-phosphate transaminase (isomerizing) [Bacteroidota bacterium]|nr:glutamine--fructose-6-phosphate transaminase (isomerizing) [Bacteroidota bacterium]
MCGIVGYIGFRDAIPILMEGLKRLEYRGYDSAGIATIFDNGVQIYKKAGKVAELSKYIEANGISSQMGIGHTRWATHGEPNNVNAHPHTDCTETISVIHNGIIENFSTLKKKLEQEGHIFKTETDTESLSHLIEEMLKHTNDLFTAVRLALNEVEGTYGIAVISKNEPDKIIAARKGSPIVIGIGENENFIASDAAALISHTRQVVYLEDGEIACITKDGFYTKTIFDEAIKKQVEEITFDLEQIEKGGFDHFMLKEINEQPETLRNSIRGRILSDEGTSKLGGLSEITDVLMNARRFIITACGTSWHAALVGKYMLEQYAKIPVDVEYASEFRYRDPVIYKDDVVFLISQSGETADTLAALKKAKSAGAHVLGIVNVVGSTIARESDAGIYIHAGPEIGVASTKAFTSQLAVLSLITLMMSRKRGGMSQADGRQVVRELLKLPEKVDKILKDIHQIQQIADTFYLHGNFLYLGRGYNFPVALEGALKLKEISYIHAEGYPAAEMKHGPIALIDNEMPVVVIATKDSTYEKILSNIQEVRTRKGRIIAIANEDDDNIHKLAEHVIRIPHTLDFLMPILSIIPLQLLSYYIAVKRGCDVDQPRNLAKSVTVE